MSYFDLVQDLNRSSTWYWYTFNLCILLKGFMKEIRKESTPPICFPNEHCYDIASDGKFVRINIRTSQEKR